MTKCNVEQKTMEIWIKYELLLVLYQCGLNFNKCKMLMLGKLSMGYMGTLYYLHNFSEHLKCLFKEMQGAKLNLNLNNEWFLV